MNTDQRRAQWRASYYKNLEANRVKAKERQRIKRDSKVETPEESEARRAYHLAYYRAKTGPKHAEQRRKKSQEELASLIPQSEQASTQFKMIMIGLLSEKHKAHVDYRRQWKQKRYGYKPREPKQVVIKERKPRPPKLTEEERKVKIKEYHSRPDVQLKKRESRRQHYRRVKARADSDPEFAIELRKSRKEAGMKWASKIKTEDPERYAMLVSEYKERDRIRRQRKWASQEFRARQYEWFRNRRKECPEFKLSQYVRNAVNDALRGRSKSSRAFALTGCDPAQLKLHLESFFQEGMSWNNWGTEKDNWQIDHVRPLASFDLSDPEQQKSAFNFKNLKPEWAGKNNSKSSTWNGRKWRHSDHALQVPAPA